MRAAILVFVAGATATGARTVDALRRYAADAGVDVDIQIVDVLDDPMAAETHRVMATPTVIRTLPLPSVRLVGDISGESDLDFVCQTLFPADYKNP